MCLFVEVIKMARAKNCQQGAKMQKVEMQEANYSGSWICKKLNMQIAYPCEWAV